MNDEVVMNYKEAAQFLGVSQTFLKNLRAARKVPCHKIDNRIFFLKSELIEWVKKAGE